MPVTDCGCGLAQGKLKFLILRLCFQCPLLFHLQNDGVFKDVYIDYGVTVWNNGDVDIAPEVLYRDGVAVDETATA